MIHYSYLWQREARAGQDEGVKDRPCAVILATTDEEGRTRVYAVPITHSQPSDDTAAIEIPVPVKDRLGLDSDRSWIVVSEANVFVWPGPDLRFVTSRGSDSAAYGYLPPGFFRVVRDRFLALDRHRKAALVKRTE